MAMICNIRFVCPFSIANTRSCLEVFRFNQLEDSFTTCWMVCRVQTFLEKSLLQHQWDKLLHIKADVFQFSKCILCRPINQDWRDCLNCARRQRCWWMLSLRFPKATQHCKHLRSCPVCNRVEWLGNFWARGGNMHFRNNQFIYVYYVYLSFTYHIRSMYMF